MKVKLVTMKEQEAQLDN